MVEDIKVALNNILSSRGYLVVASYKSYSPVVGTWIPLPIGTIIEGKDIIGVEFDHPFRVVAFTDLNDLQEQFKLLPPRKDYPNPPEDQPNSVFYRVITD